METRNVIFCSDNYVIEKRTYNGRKWYVLFCKEGWNKFYDLHRLVNECRRNRK